MEKRLLGVFAHPDDETFGPSGTIWHVAGQPDGRSRVVIATRGEAGTIGISKQYSPEALGRVRQYELFAAARVLEADVTILGFPDRHVPEVDPRLALELIVQEIRRFRPHVIVTFHPNGISGHPDHTAMSRHARAAFDAAADPQFAFRLAPADGRAAEPWQPLRLFYYGVTKSRAKALEHFRVVEAIEDDEIDLTLDVSRHLARKHAACRAHDTQMDFIRQLEQAAGGIDRFWAEENHVLAAWRGEKPAARLTDPFEGLELDG